MSKSILKSEEILKEQGERFSKVLDYLKTGIKERKNNSEVINEINGLCTTHLISSDFSKFKNGEVIPEYVLEALYKLHHINPDYILGKSECMVDLFAEFIDKIKGKKIDEREPGTIIAQLFIININDLEYLSIEMDSRFFDYITSISPEKLMSPHTEKNDYPNSFILNEKERNELITEIQGKKKSQHNMYALIPVEELELIISQKPQSVIQSELLLLKQDFENLKNMVNNEVLSSEIQEKINRIDELKEN